jgi:hypothetical protein
MKKLEMTRELKLNHYKYCLGKKKKQGYSLHRPYGRLIRYQSLNYPRNIKMGKTTIKIKLAKNTREAMTKYLINNFKSIIVGTPVRILELEIEFYTLIHSEEMKVNRAVTMIEVKVAVKEFLYRIFRYETFASAEPTSKWGAYQLVEGLNNSVCVYCNSQFTVTVYRTDESEGRKMQIRPSLDHFFPRSKHPLLGVSIYNLIPSCHTCNSSLKGDKDISLEEIIHPYIDNLDDLGYFEREFNTNLPDTFVDYSDYYSQVVGRSTNYTIKLKPFKKSYNEKLNLYEELFEIEKRYSQHKKFINDFVKRNIIYTTIYLDKLKDSYCFLFTKTYSLKELIIEEDINNNILSKVVKDITLKEFNNIDK